MKNIAVIFSAVLLIIFAVLYAHFEYAMHNADGGLGLGAYLMYLGALLAHCLFLISGYIIEKIKNQLGNKLLFRIHIV